MLRIYVISLVFFFHHSIINGQEIEKEKVYLVFQKNNGNQFKSLGKKFKMNNAININLYKYYFFHNYNMKRDTLCIKNYKNFKITEERDLEELAKKWRIKNKESLKKKFGVLYRQATQNRNNIFDITIIEKISDKQMVLYEAVFRNEGVID